MGNAALGSLGFIIGTIISLYAAVPALRFVLQWVRADYHNQFAQAIVTLSNPILVPLRRVIPSFGRYDTASLLMVYGVLFFKFLIFKLLPLGAVSGMGRVITPSVLSMPQILAVTFIDVIYLLFNVFIFSLIIKAILSWIPNAHGNPIQGVLDSITAPIMRPLRGLIPPIGGFDLSVMVAIIGLFALRMFVVGSLTSILLG